MPSSSLRSWQIQKRLNDSCHIWAVIQRGFKDTGQIKGQEMSAKGRTVRAGGRGGGGCFEGWS